MADWITKYKSGYYAKDIIKNLTLLSSPFIRTMQTCSRFSAALRNKFNDD